MTLAIKPSSIPPVAASKTVLSALPGKRKTPIPNIPKSQLTSSWNISSMAVPLSILAGAIIGAKIGLNLCTVWLPGPALSAASPFCLFYVVPHCAFIGGSLVFIVSTFLKG